MRNKHERKNEEKFLRETRKENLVPLIVSEKIGYLEFELREQKNQRSRYKGRSSLRDEVLKKKLTRRKRKFLQFRLGENLNRNSRRVVCTRQRLNPFEKFADENICPSILGDDRPCKFETFRGIRTNRPDLTVNNAATTQRDLSAGFSETTISFSEKGSHYFSKFAALDT